MIPHHSYYVTLSAAANFKSGKDVRRSNIPAASTAEVLLFGLGENCFTGILRNTLFIAAYQSLAKVSSDLFSYRASACRFVYTRPSLSSL